jgi:hypothetical protein
MGDFVWCGSDCIVSFVGHQLKRSFSLVKRWQFEDGKESYLYLQLLFVLVDY